MLHLFIPLCDSQNPEGAGGPREGEDGAAGRRRTLREEEILLLTVNTASTHSSTTLY